MLIRHAIETRYLGPTNRLGSRIVAKSASGHRIMLDWDDALNTDENHRAAAKALANKLGWTNRLITGALSDSYVHVFIDERS